MIDADMTVDEIDLQLRVDLSDDLPQPDARVRLRQRLEVHRGPGELARQIEAGMGGPSGVIDAANLLEVMS